MTRHLGITFMILHFIAGDLLADNRAQADQASKDGQANSTQQAAYLATLASKSKDSSMKYALMMMAMQQQMQANAYKSSRDKQNKDDDKDKKEDEKSKQLIAMPSPQPESPIQPSKPDEATIRIADEAKNYQSQLQAQTPGTSSASGSNQGDSLNLGNVTIPNMQITFPSRNTATAPTETTAVAAPATSALAAIPESAKRALASEIPNSTSNSNGSFTTPVVGGAAGVLNPKELDKLSTAIEQTVTPSAARRFKTDPEASSESTSAASGGESSSGGSSSFDSFFEALNEQMETGPGPEAVYEDTMGAEYGDFKTGDKKVPNVFQVAQLMYQVVSEQDRVQKKTGRKTSLNTTSRSNVYAQK